jgi:acyl carrier protein
MTDDEILAAIAELAREHLGFEGPLAPEMRLVQGLALDSMRLLTLALEVEHRFDLSLEGVDGASVERVGDLVRLVATKLDQATPTKGT